MEPNVKPVPPLPPIEIPLHPDVNVPLDTMMMVLTPIVPNVKLLVFLVPLEVLVVPVSSLSPQELFQILVLAPIIISITESTLNV